MTPLHTHVQHCSHDEGVVTMCTTRINEPLLPPRPFDSQEDTWKIQRARGMGLLALVLGANLMVGHVGAQMGLHTEKTFSQSASGRLPFLLMPFHPSTPMLQTRPSDS